MIDLSNPEVSFALESVRQASRLVQQIQSEMVSPALTKDDRSPVTVADFAAQALIGSLLVESFPDDILVAEESSSALKDQGNHAALGQITSYVSRIVLQATEDQVCDWIDLGTADPQKRFWVLDPIDGTKGFLRGEQYAVALALVEDDQVQIGVLGCPNLIDGRIPDYQGSGSLVVAVRGQGTWVTPMNGEIEFKKLTVSSRREASEVRILRSFEAAHTNTSQIDKLAHKLGAESEPVRMDSQAKYALLAAGEGDLLLRMLSPERKDYREKIWDQAAGSIVVEEAGGKATDLDGKPLDFSKGRTLAENRGVLASNGLLHQSTLQALKAVESYE